MVQTFLINYLFDSHQFNSLKRSGCVDYLPLYRKEGILKELKKHIE